MIKSFTLKLNQFPTMVNPFTPPGGHSLLDNHTSDIKTQISDEVGLDSLKKEDGVTRFVKKMNEAFWLEAQSKVYDIFCDYFLLKTSLIIL